VIHAGVTLASSENKNRPHTSASRTRTTFALGKGQVLNLSKTVREPRYTIALTYDAISAGA
jgi:hypothetical protein